MVLELDGTIYITGDHGKADEMFHFSYNQPKTAHSVNPVYFLMLNKRLENSGQKLNLHGLYDIAPFIL